MTKLIDFYNVAKSFVIENGYQSEIDYCKNRKPLSELKSKEFYMEYVWVVLNAGMKEQIARKTYEKFFQKLDFNVIGHEGKRKAIKTGIIKYRIWFKNIRKMKTKDGVIHHLSTLPFIGDITKYHLARNIGIDTIKPDRHLTRLANRFNYSDAFKMCNKIQKATGDRLGVIDVVLWRYCNIKGS